MPSSKKKETATADAELSPSIVAELERRVNQVKRRYQHHSTGCIGGYRLFPIFLIIVHILIFFLSPLSHSAAFRKFSVTILQFRSAVQKSLVDDGLGDNVLGEMSDSGSEIDWEAEERKADLEEAGSREAITLPDHELFTSI